MSILEEINLTFYHGGELHSLSATPYLLPVENGMPACFNAKLNGKNIGDINRNMNQWLNDEITDAALLSRIGCLLSSCYRT